MQVILLERIEKLGQMGDTVAVKDGYARNFLIPKGKALRATQENIVVFSEKKTQLEATNLKLKKEAEDVAKKLKDYVLTMIRQAGENGHLYGSVSTKDIAENLTKERCAIARSQVELSKPIKELSLHPVKIILHPEVSLELTVNVALSVEEAEKQLKEDAATEEKDVKSKAEKKTKASQKKEEVKSAKEGETEASQEESSDQFEGKVIAIEETGGSEEV